LIPPVIADTGGLLRALARTPEGKASFPDYREILISASAVIVPGLVLAEVDYFLRADRRVMRKLIAEIFDPATRYEYELPLPSDIARALELDARFGELNLGLIDVPRPDHRPARLQCGPCWPAPHARTGVTAMTEREADSEASVGWIPYVVPSLVYVVPFVADIVCIACSNSAGTIGTLESKPEIPHGPC
jgi:hypothetical protein